MNISLPIPEFKLISKAFVWVPYSTASKASMHTFTIKSHESIGNLRKYLTAETLKQVGLCSDD